MGAAQREWAKRARLKLIEELGGKCVQCGSIFALEIDHKFKRHWDLQKCDPSGRVSIYRREAKLGLVTVRCKTCNVRRGKPAEEAFAFDESGF